MQLLSTASGTVAVIAIWVLAWNTPSRTGWDCVDPKDLGFECFGMFSPSKDSNLNARGFPPKPRFATKSVGRVSQAKVEFWLFMTHFGKSWTFTIFLWKLTTNKSAEKFLQTVGLPKDDVGNGDVPWCGHYTLARSYTIPPPKNKQQKPLQRGRAPKRKVIFQLLFFRGFWCYVSFREGTFSVFFWSNSSTFFGAWFEPWDDGTWWVVS